MAKTSLQVLFPLNKSILDLTSELFPQVCCDCLMKRWTSPRIRLNQAQWAGGKYEEVKSFSDHPIIQFYRDGFKSNHLTSHRMLIWT